MVHHIAKRQKVDELETGEEAVLFNSDTLVKIISYLPSIDVLNLALACKRFGISNNNDSIIKESARLLVREIATEEQLAALPRYDGESSLADYHYLQLLQAPLMFDQLVGAEYVNNEDKTCVRYYDRKTCTIGWETAFSNNILRAGKHYVSFTPLVDSKSFMMGIMRPGLANQNAKGYPFGRSFLQNFNRDIRHGERNNNVNCCFYDSYDGVCYSGDWFESSRNGTVSDAAWDGRESMSSGDEIGLLLDLDEGTLSVYKNGGKLGIMKRGLAGQYCWVVSLLKGTGVTIKRGKIPTS